VDHVVTGPEAFVARELFGSIGKKPADSVVDGVWSLKVRRSSRKF
jgi:hypothetical protein